MFNSQHLSLEEKEKKKTQPQPELSADPHRGDWGNVFTEGEIKALTICVRYLETALEVWICIDYT